jgi:hypothetical protein
VWHVEELFYFVEYTRISIELFRRCVAKPRIAIIAADYNCSSAPQWLIILLSAGVNSNLETCVLEANVRLSAMLIDEDIPLRVLIASFFTSTTRYSTQLHNTAARGTTVQPSKLAP